MGPCLRSSSGCLGLALIALSAAPCLWSQGPTGPDPIGAMPTNDQARTLLIWAFGLLAAGVCVAWTALRMPPPRGEPPRPGELDT